MVSNKVGKQKLLVVKVHHHADRRATSLGCQLAGVEGAVRGCLHRDHLREVLASKDNYLLSGKGQNDPHGLMLGRSTTKSFYDPSADLQLKVARKHDDIHSGHAV